MTPATSTVAPGSGVSTTSNQTAPVCVATDEGFG